MTQQNVNTQFELVGNISANALLSALNTFTTAKKQRKQIVHQSYYDSFDGRLAENGLSADYCVSSDNAVFSLRQLTGETVIASAALTELPIFAHQFESAALRTRLEPVLENRALLKLCTMSIERHCIDILDKRQKIIVRLEFEQCAAFNNRVSVIALKGYVEQAHNVVAQLKRLQMIKNVVSTRINSLPAAYNAKIRCEFTADTSAEHACRDLLKQLFQLLKANQPGVIAHLDNEFLHDYRVAVRRTRVLLSQMKTVEPDYAYQHFSEFFTWLGAVTSPTRDLDVYVEQFTQYQSCLPAALSADLLPFRDVLLNKQASAQQALAEHLNSAKYLDTLTAWDAFLHSSQALPIQPATLSIKTLADKKIRRLFKRVLQQGRAITDASSPECLHDLRKTCKKLRYLLEFFQSLYPTKVIKAFVQPLKDMQEMLGRHQDFCVQEQQLGEFSEELRVLNTPSATLIALQALITVLDKNRQQTRDEFSQCFSQFSGHSTLSLFNRLFTH